MPLSGHFEFGLQMVASESNETEFLLSFPTRFIMGIFAMSTKFARVSTSQSSTAFVQESRNRIRTITMKLQRLLDGY